MYLLVVVKYFKTLKQLKMFRKFRCLEVPKLIQQMERNSVFKMLVFSALIFSRFFMYSFK